MIHFTDIYLFGARILLDIL